ncbi:MAG: SgcJ/EcaC family oxidoreductase [Sphingomonadales bacterium]|nr:SgcJ/EcaC family oxidoreductase [Sphingomonadales bacterium]
MNDAEALVRRFLSLWSTRDADGMVACFAEDGVYDNVPARSPMQGRAAIRTWLDMVFAHITRIEVEIRNIAVDGEWVYNERLDDHVAGDRHMPLPVMNLTRVVGGRIVLFRDYYDMDTVRALGMG